MQQLTYTKLNKSETRDALALVNPHMEAAPLDPETSDIISASLPFYSGYRLFEITDRAQSPARKRYVVYRGEDLVVLNFTNAPIYALNERAPISLSKETIYDYIRFFFRFVRGRHGQFTVIEAPEDIQWREDPSPNARRALGEMIEPLHIKEIAADGSYIVSACLIFKDGLFQCDATVQQNGVIRLSNEKLALENLPIIDDTLEA